MFIEGADPQTAGLDGTGPADVPEPPQTGDSAVDEVVTWLAAAAAGPLDTHVAVYEAVHRTLQDRLADVEG